MATLLIKNIGILQTPTGSHSHKGKEQGENLKLKDAAILIKDGVIEEITSDGKLPQGKADEVIDAEGRLVTPGLVDGHTHMTNYEQTPLYRVIEAVKFEAARYGVHVTKTEIIGLCPMKALIDTAEYYMNSNDILSQK